MWRKEDVKSQEVPEISTGFENSTSASAALPPTPREQNPQLAVPTRAVACISQGIKIHGEIVGSEDLFLDGEVDGKLDLAGGSVTIGPNGRVHADVNAREVIVRGRLIGKVTGKERVQIWNTGRVEGEIRTERLAIEDGAVLRGKVETGKPTEKPGTASQGQSKPFVEKSETLSTPTLRVSPAAD
jgi:cytoskeletal protein CcmA (bactofilin family)